MHISTQQILQILLMYVVVFKYNESSAIYNSTLLVSLVVGTRNFVASFDF